MKPPDYIFVGAAWPLTPVIRHQTWVDYYRKLFPDSKLVIVNDGPDEGHWPRKDVEVVYLSPRLGRRSHYDHAGCFRSIFYMQQYFDKSTKVIWLDWDFYIVSQRFLDWVCDIKRGWRGVWCSHFGFPETSLMVVCYNEFGRFNEFAGRWDAVPKVDEFEKHVPFTEVNRDFIGGRYVDVGETPPDYADYISQTPQSLAEVIAQSLP